MAIQLPTALFALTFPGTILYYAAISTHVMPPIGTGFFGLMCAVSLLFLAPTYITKILRNGKIPTIDFSFIMFLVFFLTIVLWHGLHAPDKTVMTWHIVSIAQSMSVFLLCKSTLESSKQISPTIFTGWLLATICILTVTVDGRFSLREISDDAGTIPSYQTFALCYMLTSVVIANTITGRNSRYALHGVTIACLYTISARSEFVGYIFFIATLEFLSFKKKSTPIILASIVIGLSLIAIVAGMIELPESRITALADLEQDNSSNERDRIAREGMNKIFESPIFGAYGQYEEGRYIHNIMSAWQETGIIGMLFFFAMLGVPTAKLVSKIIRGGTSHNTNLAMSILLTTILLLVAGKYFTYLLVPAALAAYSAASKEKRITQRDIAH